MKDFDLSKIFDSMKKNEISELIIKEGSKTYEVRRGGFANQGNLIQQGVAPIAQQVVQQPIVQTVSPVESSAQPTEDAGSSASNFFEQKSPLVGTFYASPNPESPAFVAVGDKVVKGQTLCMVEAMKNFNEIDSEIDGVVKEICANNGELVEFGQVLFRIDAK